MPDVQTETHPCKRLPMSGEQRARLSAAQLAYIANDRRWAAHRQKLADAQIARRMTLFPNEIEAIVTMRVKGRTFSYIAEEMYPSAEDRGSGALTR